MAYQVRWTSEASQMLRNIPDRRIRAQILRRADRLANDPGRQGRPLGGDMASYRSVRASGQRYRIVFRVEEGEVRVVVVSAGIRREGDRQDIYALTRRVIRLGLVDPSE